VNAFEIILEQSGKLLKECLQPCFHSPKAVEQLYFKDIFRQAVRHGLLAPKQAKRWLAYRDNRNVTTRDYGVGFAEETMTLMPEFIEDARKLASIIGAQSHD